MKANPGIHRKPIFLPRHQSRAAELARPFPREDQLPRGAAYLFAAAPSPDEISFQREIPGGADAGRGEALQERGILLRTCVPQEKAYRLCVTWP